MTRLRGTLIAIAALAVFSGVAGMGQRQSNPPPQPPPSSRTNFPPMMPPMSGIDTNGSPDILNSRMAEQQARSRNNERQRRLESDTEKLVGLVNSFKEQVQSGMSPADMSKKAEEIEKLAKSVKDRMKG